MASMFEILMNLPLFRGVSHEKLAQVVGEAKFHFLKYPAGELVVREGESCTHIAFVISPCRWRPSPPGGSSPGRVCREFSKFFHRSFPYIIPFHRGKAR